MWPAEGKREPIVLRGHTDQVQWAAFSPDGARIVTASLDGTAQVWAANGKGKAIVLHGHEGSVYSAAFSPDGTRAATASRDGTARVWSADGEGQPVVLGGHEARVNSASFSSNVKLVVTASEDKTARIWPIATALLQQALHNKTTDCLTPLQRQTYPTRALATSNANGATTVRPCPIRDVPAPLLIDPRHESAHSHPQPPCNPPQRHHIHHDVPPLNVRQVPLRYAARGFH